MVAEDHPILAELLEALLTGQTWIEFVGRAADGLAAVALAAATEPDLILMDVEMPLVDGIEATRCITARSAAVVLVLTGNATPSVARAAQQAGAAAVLPKQVTEEQLLAQIRAVYDGCAPAAP